MSLINEKAPKAVKSVPMDMLAGKVVALDAPMAMYQFLIATQTFTQGKSGIGELRDAEGNLTGHLVGIWHRTIQFMENGIKPIWVFDGKPPEMKAAELEKRKEMKEKAEEERKEAEEKGDMNRAKQMAGRSVRITKDMIEDAKKLVRLMGAVVIESPGEAEAQCAELVKQGMAFATATEDMDALTFGTNYLLRGFNSKKEPIIQICLKEILDGFGMNHTEFIDLCILCGCDYTQSIGGMGPTTAFKFMKEHGDIETVLSKVKELNEDEKRKKKYIIPEPFLYEKSRIAFVSPDVWKDEDELKKHIVFTKPQEEEIKDWLLNKKGFAENKVNSGMERLLKCQVKKNQMRLDNFFKKSSVLSVSKKVEAPVGKNKGKNAAKKATGKKTA